MKTFFSLPKISLQICVGGKKKSDFHSLLPSLPPERMTGKKNHGKDALILCEAIKKPDYWQY